MMRMWEDKFNRCIRFLWQVRFVLLHVVFFMVVLVLLKAFLGATSVVSKISLAFTIPFLILVWFRPWIVSILAIIAVSTLFIEVPQVVAFGGFGLYAGEAFVVMGMLVILLRLALERDFWRLDSSIVLYISIFLLWIGFSFFNGVFLQDVSFRLSLIHI